MDVKSQIINIAQDLIQRNGIDSFSFRTLAEEVNIKSASVHYHFPKKEDLLAEVAKKYNQDFSAALSEISSTKSTAKKKLLGLLGLFENTKVDNKICLCAMFASMSESLSDGSAKEVEIFFKELTSWVSGVLSEAEANKQLKSELSKKTLTNLIVASLEGALLLDRLNVNYKYLKSCKDLINDIIA